MGESCLQRSNARHFGLGKVHFGGLVLPAVAPAIRFWAFSPFGRVRPRLFFAFGVARFARLRRLVGFPPKRLVFGWLGWPAMSVFRRWVSALGLFPGLGAAGFSVRLARLARQVYCQVFQWFFWVRPRFGAFFWSGCLARKGSFWVCAFKNRLRLPAGVKTCFWVGRGGSETIKTCPTLRAGGRAGGVAPAQRDSAPKAGSTLWLFPAKSPARR